MLLSVTRDVDPLAPASASNPGKWSLSVSSTLPDSARCANGTVGTAGVEGVEGGCIALEVGRAGDELRPQERSVSRRHVERRVLSCTYA